MSIGRRIDPAEEKKAEEELHSTEAIKQEKAKERSVVFTPQEPQYAFDDLILPSHVRSKLLDAAEYAINSQLVFEQWGLKETHKYSKRMGINFYGPPGTGKTMAAHALAKFLGRKILIVNYADIESKYVGDTPKNICAAFEAAKASNSIIFFDEADAILSRRVTNMNNATDVSVNQTRSVLLMLLNDYQDYVVFATNFIENFDPAFMRRISMHIQFELPDLECRKILWQKYIPEKMPITLDYNDIAKKYENLSGSDISNAVLMGAFKAARDKAEVVDSNYMYEAAKDILASKAANNGKKNVTKKVVSEEYVKTKLEPEDIQRIEEAEIK